MNKHEFMVVNLGNENKRDYSFLKKGDADPDLRVNTSSTIENRCKRKLIFLFT